VHQPVSRGFAVFADAWLSGWLAEISADLRENGSALEVVLHDYALYKSTTLLYFTLHCQQQEHCPSRCPGVCHVPTSARPHGQRAVPTWTRPTDITPPGEYPLGKIWKLALNPTPDRNRPTRLGLTLADPRGRGFFLTDTNPYSWPCPTRGWSLGEYIQLIFPRTSETR